MTPTGVGVEEPRTSRFVRFELTCRLVRTQKQLVDLLVRQRANSVNEIWRLMLFCIFIAVVMILLVELPPSDLFFLLGYQCICFLSVGSDLVPVVNDCLFNDCSRFMFSALHIRLIYVTNIDPTEAVWLARRASFAAAVVGATYHIFVACLDDSVCSYPCRLEPVLPVFIRRVVYLPILAVPRHFDRLDNLRVHLPDLKFVVGLRFLEQYQDTGVARSRHFGHGLVLAAVTVLSID